MISQNTIQQILSRIDIIDVIGAFVKLKKRGTNYLGLCPFHNERTPSFTVSPSKEIYKCFGCGKSGNTISFLMEHEKYSYVDSLRWLANKYGIEIEETFATDEQKQQMQVADSLYIINNFAQQFFSKILFETEEGRNVGLSYLKERGFREDIIKKFQLGYNPEARDSFTKAAIAAQYNTELLIKTGLVANRNDQLMDNYRGRIIFPVHNQSGKILGFGARVLKSNDKAPKYINTPENEIYLKSKILYGSYFARQAMDKADECLLVEGYTDVISLHQAGIENVVASGGTSLTLEQVRLIKRYTKQITMIYDGDTAGIKASLRGLEIALEEGMNVKLVLIPDNEDPDSYVNKVGSSGFLEFLRKNKKDFVLFQLEVSLNDAGNDPVKKSEVVNSIAETISRINKVEDFTKQEDYIKQCSQILKIDEAGLHSLVNKYIQERITTDLKATIPSGLQVQKINDNSERTDWSKEAFSILFQDQLQEQAIIRVILEHGSKTFGEKTVADCIFAEIEDSHPEEIFEDRKLLELYRTYKNLHDHGSSTEIKDFTNLNDSGLVSTVIAITNFPYELSRRWTEEEMATHVNQRIFDLNYEDFMREVVNNEDADKVVYYHEIDDNYKNEVNDVIRYLKIRKINRMILQNQTDIADPQKNHELDVNIKAHLSLKELQIALGKQVEIVIFPFG